MVIYKKEIYEAPVLELIEMETEGTVMSGSLVDMTPGSNVRSVSRSSYYNRSSASSSDLEDMIEDILTTQP